MDSSVVGRRIGLRLAAVNSDVTKLSLVICLRNEALSAVMLRAAHTLNPRRSISIIFTPPLNFGRGWKIVLSVLSFGGGGT